MKTQIYDAIKWLSIKMSKFQQHDLVLKLSNKMFGHLMTSENLSFVPINLFQQEG